MGVIDPSAKVAEGAVLGSNVSIGPFCVVGPNVTLGDGVKLLSHVVVEGHTTIGAGTHVHPFAVLGSPPQSVHYKGEPTRLEIGAGCVIREGVTMNVGTVGGGGITRVGDRGMFMAYSHVAHDCLVGNDVIFANAATLAGHCTVGDFVFMGGLAAAHQFLRIGSYAIVGGLTPLDGDVIPFGNAYGARGELQGLNLIGLKRRGFSREAITRLRRAYSDLFLAPGSFADRVARVADTYGDHADVMMIVDFIRADSKRRILKPARRGEPDDAA